LEGQRPDAEKRKELREISGNQKGRGGEREGGEGAGFQHIYKRQILTRVKINHSPHRRWDPKFWIPPFNHMS
jgi:hypothetical protein